MVALPVFEGGRLEGSPLAFAADAAGYGESRGMRVDVLSERRTSKPDDRWQKGMIGNNIPFLDVEVTVWTSR